jgi:hypothetical protein
MPRRTDTFYPCMRSTITDSIIIDMIRGNSYFTKFHLQGCPLLTDESVLEIARNFPNTIELHLNGDAQKSRTHP